eukprot:scaffold1190_cov173-Skeletonema_dohrnii-CCMP3373.AAC.1
MLPYLLISCVPPSRPMRSMSGVLESSRLGVQSASLDLFLRIVSVKKGSLSASSAKSKAAAVLFNRGQNLIKIQNDPLESSLQSLSFINIIFTTIIGASISLPLELAKNDHLRQARTLMAVCSKSIKTLRHERSCPPPDLLLVASFSLRLNSLNWPRTALGKYYYMTIHHRIIGDRYVSFHSRGDSCMMVAK